MREHHLQTPLKEVGNRRSKSISDQTKKPLKTAKKSLNSAFELHGNVAFPESSPKESIGSCLTSDDHYLLAHSPAEDLLLIPETYPPSSEALDVLAYPTPGSSTLTSDKSKESSGSFGIPQSTVMTGSIEVEMAVKYLREAQMHVMNATDADIRYKKLLDAVINTVVEEFYGLPEQRDWCGTRISDKFHLVTLTLLWIIAVFIGLFFCSGTKHSFNGPLPT